MTTSLVRTLTCVATALAVATSVGCAQTAGPATSAVSPSQTPTVTGSPQGTPQSDVAFAELETRFDARLGVVAIETGTGATVEWRADERFPYASTFKALAAAALLDDVGVDGMSRRVSFSSDDLVTYSPVTEKSVGTGMTLAEVADAAVRFSDNTAGNLLLESLGGPEGLDRRLDEVGDDVTVVSRWETALNEGIPGDDRDTSTPRALASTLREYTLGATLDADERELLTGWLIGTTTGDTLVRADLPPDWVVGDKSGAGGHGTRNDIAIVYPPDSDPLVIAVLSTRGIADAEYDDRLIAEAAAAAVAALGVAR